jgi:hypothetical protein
MVARTMGDAKQEREISEAEKDRRARQAASLRKTLASPEARALKSEAAKRAWTPERHARQTATMKETWTDPEVSASRIRGIEKAWTPERREAQRAATERIMADPEQNARRVAGLRRSSFDPELKALRIANLKKALADPVVNKRRIEKMKQTLHTPEMNARRSARLKKMHADARAGLAHLREIQNAGDHGPGRPTKEARNARIEELHQLGLSDRNIARETEPDFAENPNAAKNRVRSVRNRMKRSKEREAPR